jgi:hypothetical protein
MKRSGIAVWTMRIALALMFGIPAAFKLGGDQLWADEFTRIGVGLWLMYAVAALEIVAVGLVLYPPTTTKGVVGMVGITIAAFGAQLFWFGHFIHIGVYLAILAAVYWRLQRHAG